MTRCAPLLPRQKGAHDTHTPEPWGYDPETGDVFCVHASSLEHASIARVWDNDGFGRRWPDGVQAANGRLIAAAPELLAALKLLMPAMDKVWGYEGDVFGSHHNDAVDAWSAAEAAIAEAEGGNPT